MLLVIRQWLHLTEHVLLIKAKLLQSMHSISLNFALASFLCKIALFKDETWGMDKEVSLN